MHRQDRMSHNAILVTSSATTGWFDWIHGEIWLYPDGMLRIPLDLKTTLLHSMGLSINEVLRKPHFHNEDRTIFFASRKRIWVPRTAIQRAYLHHGFITDRLRLFVEHQHTIKLLWTPQEEAWQLLQATLTKWLGNQLIID